MTIINDQYVISNITNHQYKVDLNLHLKIFLSFYFIEIFPAKFKI